MSYSIDGATVNDRTDWQMTRRPSPPQGRRVEQFPGIAERFVVTGPAMPPDVIAFGFLVGTAASPGAAIDAIHSQLTEFEEMTGDGQVHSIEHNSVTFGDCHLVSLEVLGPFQNADDSGGQSALVGVRVPVRFVWSQLRFS